MKSSVGIPVNDAVRGELAKLAKRGRLNPESVVAASKSPKSPLHPYFLWDSPDEAAHLGRLEIARYAIRHVRIEPHLAEDLRCSVNVRQYHGTGRGEYLGVRAVMGDEAERAALLKRAIRDFEALRVRYEHLEELEGVFKEIQRVLSLVLV